MNTTVAESVVAARWLESAHARQVGLVAGITVGVLVAIAPSVSSRAAPVSDYPDASDLARASHLVVGMSFILVGLLAWSRRPENRTGVLMTLAGFAYFGVDLGWIDTPATFIFADEWRGIFYVLLFWLLLAFPSGRLGPRIDRIVIASFAMYAALVRPFLSAAFYDPNLEGPFDTPGNPLLVRGDPDLNTSVDRWLSYVDLAFLVVLFALVVNHWRRSGRRERRALTPVFAVAGATAGALLVGVLVGAKSQQSLTWGYQLALALLPLGFLVGLLRSRLARAAVADLVIELQLTQDPTRIRNALARALDDQTLEVGYWIESSDTYVTAGDAAVDVPPATPGRACTIVRGDDKPVAALVYDASLSTEEPELVDAVAATARLALENQRLQAELRAQLDEVRASRARIVAAGDAERRRLERDLHDGAQQRLLALGLALQLARAEVGDRTSGADALLSEAEHELRDALEELRELARGIHPAILTDGGLTPALRTLAERAPIPVEIVATTQPVTPAVDTAAYFLVSEALANVAKHAHASGASVRVSTERGRLVVVVEDDGIGGADIDSGSGLRGLEDRVQALGGSFDVRSGSNGTRIRAELPCG